MKYSALAAFLFASISAFSQKIGSIPVEKQLAQGWNLIAYTETAPARIDSALAQIWDKVERVKDESRIFSKIGNESTNTLTHLQPASGYWVKVSEPCTMKWKAAAIDTACCKLAFPSTLTPNGDDTKLTVWKPIISDCCVLGKYSLQIYNHYGELVFKTHDQTEGWNGMKDGVAYPEGVYYCLLSYKAVENDIILKRVLQLLR